MYRYVSNGSSGAEGASWRESGSNIRRHEEFCGSGVEVGVVLLVGGDGSSRGDGGHGREGTLVLRSEDTRRLAGPEDRVGISGVRHTATILVVACGVVEVPGRPAIIRKGDLRAAGGVAYADDALDAVACVVDARGASEHGVIPGGFG